jgi:nucleoside-diphosphate-sugar epimerase
MANKLINNVATSRCALVTGATGYIGSNLVGGLLAEGWQVHVIMRASSSRHLLAPYLNRITGHDHDGSVGGMMNILAASKPKVVYHLAAMASSEHRMENVDQMVSANVLFSTQLVEAMFRNGTKNLVNTETFWQYSKGAEEYAPVCLYAATKQAFRDILIYYTGNGHVNALSLVLYDTYGPDDPRKKLLTFLKQAAQEKRQIEMSPGEQIVDLMHIDDIVSAYLHAGETLLSQKDCNFKTYSVTSGQRMTLRELVELIVRETGITLQPKWGGKPYRTNEVMEPWLGKPLPGWQPKVDFSSGVHDVFKRVG